MGDEIAFFDLVANSAVFVAALDEAKAAFRSTVGEIGAGSTQIQRDMLAAQAAVDKATAALAAQRAEAAQARFATGQISAPALALSQARSQKAAVTSQASSAASTEASAPMMSGLGGQVGMMAALAAVGGAAMGLAALDKLVNTTAQYSAEVLRNSQAIGLNNQDMQLWDQLATKVGLSQDTLVRSIGFFNKEIDLGAPTLKKQQITLQDLGITSNNTGTALLQAADYFHTHTDAVQNDALAMALFGKQGLAMLPILSQGSGAIKAYGAELRSFGIIMSDTQLATGAAANVVHGEFEMALKGIEAQLTNALEPAFIELYRTIAVVTSDGKQQFAALGAGIANVVGFIAGAIGALAGMSLADLKKSSNDAGAAFDGLGASAANATGALDGTGGAAGAAKDSLAALKLATKEETDALTEQVDALQAAKQAYDDQVQAQKDSLNDQLNAIVNVNEGQRRQGEDMISYRRRLAEDDLKNQISSLDEQKTAKDRAYDEQITALNKQKADLQQHLSDEQALVSSATGAMGADYASTFAGASNSAAGFGVNLKTVLDNMPTQAWESGQKVMKVFQAMFTDPGGSLTKEANIFGALLGDAIGEHVVSGVEGAIKAQVGGPFSWLWGELMKGVTQKGYEPYIPPPTPGQGTLGSYADGGIISMPQLARLHAPEAVIPLNNPARARSLMRDSGLDQLAASGGSGGALVNQTNNFNGPIADEYVANRINARLARELARKALGMRGGIG